MRWLASGYFFVGSAGCAFVSWAMLSGHWSSSDTARSVFVGAGVVFLLFACGAVYGGVWVFRRWPRRARPTRGRRRG